MDVSESSHHSGDPSPSNLLDQDEGGIDIQPITQPTELDLLTPFSTDRAASTSSLPAESTVEPMDSQPSASPSSRVIVIPVLKTGTSSKSSYL